MIEEAEVHVPNPAPDAPEWEEVEQLPGKRKKEKDENSRCKKI